MSLWNISGLKIHFSSFIIFWRSVYLCGNLKHCLVNCASNVSLYKLFAHLLITELREKAFIIRSHLCLGLTCLYVCVRVCLCVWDADAQK